MQRRTAIPYRSLGAITAILVGIAVLSATSFLPAILPTGTDPAHARFACSPVSAVRGCAGLREMFDEQQAALSWIKVENAERDAERAIAANDHRLFGVYGYSTDVPGVEGAEFVPNGCGLRMIDGTSDYIAHEYFSAAPVAYARRYNARVLERTRCLTAPPTRRNLSWMVHDEDGRLGLALAIPNSMYDLVSFRCRQGVIELRQLRRGTAPGPVDLTLASTTEAAVRAIAEPPAQGLEGLNYASVKASLPVTHPVWRGFGETGRLRLDGQVLDAATDAEKQAIARFVSTCAARSSEPGASQGHQRR